MVRTPQFQTFDYGNAMMKGENIKSARLKNRAMSNELAQSENVIKRREEASRIRQQIESMPAAIDELDSRGYYDEADKLRANYLGQVKNGFNVAQTMAKGLNAENYSQVRQDMIQSGAITGDMWPVEYSKDWWANSLAEKKAKIQTHTRRWAENGRTMTQDFIDRDGTIFWEGNPYESGTDKNARTKAENPDGGKGFEYKAADDNAIGKQATRLFGGVYDPATGQFSGLDPQKAQKAQAVHSAASRLFAAGERRITHAQAVAEASRRLGIVIEDPDDRATIDPAGIRAPGVPDRQPTQ